MLLYANSLSSGSNWRFFELGYDPTRKPMKVIHAFIDPIIQNALLSRDNSLDIEERTFLDHLVKATSGMVRDAPNVFLHSRGTDVKIVRDGLLNLLLAARDTVSILSASLKYATDAFKDCLSFDFCDLCPCLSS